MFPLSNWNRSRTSRSVDRQAACYRERQMSELTTLLVVAAALAAAILLALALAYVPMRLLVGQMARNFRQFIQRQRERRRSERETPDRRRT
jgi:flagellar biogenesis protein FliO